MRIKLLFFIVFLFLGWEMGEVSCQETMKSIDVDYYESLCPGFKNRYDIINECKSAPLANIKETIQRLNSVISQIEKSTGLFDDVNYFEAIRLVCSAYITTGNYENIELTLYSAKKYIFENGIDVDNEYMYKYNRAAAWVEFHEGRFSSALDLLINIRKDYETKENDTVGYVSVLQDISMCYFALGETENFAQIAKESLQLTEKLRVDESTIQVKLKAEQFKAFLYIIEGRVEEGISLLEELSSTLKNNNNLSRFRLEILEVLAYLYLDNNEVDKYIKTKHTILGNKSLSVEEKISVLESLFGAEWLYGKDKDITEHAAMHSELLKSLAVNELCTFTPTKRIWKWPVIMEKVSKDSYVLTRYPNNRDMCELCYNNALFLKNMTFSSDFLIRKYVYTHQSQDLVNQLREIDSIRSFIMYDALGVEYGDTYSYDLSFMETDLMKKIPLYDFAKDQVKTWKDVRACLNEGEIAIEVMDCIVPFANDSVYSQLMALIITKHSKHPECIPLGNYFDISNDLQKLFSKDPLEINDVYSRTNNSIYKCFFERISNKLSNVKTIYFSSNTLLSFVNLGAIILPNGDRASEKWDIRMLTSTAEISPSSIYVNSTSNASLFGGGNFNSSDTLGMNGLLADVVRDISNRGDFYELKGTIEEVNSIGELFEQRNVDVTVSTGLNATEKKFRSMSGSSPQIIHVASHCFNITDIAGSPYLSRLMAIDSSEAAMIGTGFILSGANSAWNRKAQIKPDEDGVLLSEDISRMNLIGCELFVLSGCQSGEGKMSQDGVAGLQRALKRAGVKTMLVSLWNVNDEVTKDFMIAFYDNLFKYQDKYMAYKTAQLQIKKKYNDPYYWASFILID